MLPRFTVSVFALFVFATVVPTPAAAQETYHACTGFIDSIPATISTPGVWCLRRDLSTNITSGVAINIATSNVTLACNHFKVGGQAAGPSTEALGIFTSSNSGTPRNVTIHGCNVRGFRNGIELVGAGHVAEDNRVDSNIAIGIYVQGEGFTVRRNRVFVTGASEGAVAIYLRGSGDVLDNSVTAVAPGTGSAAILTDTSESENIVIAGNRLRGLVGFVYAVLAGGNVILRGNDVSASSSGVGLYCPPGSPAIARDNTISGFASGISGCANAAGNVIVP